jgi:hypothetical protein
VTRASASRRQRRLRGRPPRADQDVIDLAAALQCIGLSERKAIDLAVAWLEGKPVKPSKLPRGSRRRGGLLVAYEVLSATFGGRAATIRQKLKKPGGPTPRFGVVVALVILLTRDADAARDLARRLLAMPEPEARTEAMRILGKT